MSEQKYTEEETRVFEYLDALRESGATNMFGARPYVQEEFGFDQKKSSQLLSKWMETFSARHPRD